MHFIIYYVYLQYIFQIKMYFHVIFKILSKFIVMWDMILVNFLPTITCTITEILMYNHYLHVLFYVLIAEVYAQKL